jgi:uncharacterized protein (PEP-CTERM system associated)
MRPAKCIVSLLLLLRRRRRDTICLNLILVGLCAPCAAGEWKLGASIGAGLQLTDNVFLAPAGQQEADLVVNVTPSISATLDSARLKVRATFAPTLYAYVQNPGSDYVANNLSAFATLEAAEKFFYIDANALVAETYISPFASQPQSGASITSNRTQTTVLGLSPYIKSTTNSGISYLLRDDNTYSNGNSSVLANIYTNNLIGTIDGPTGRPVRWGADYNYNYTQFQGQPNPFTLQLARLRLTYVVDPEISVMADGGYEKNDYTANGYQGPIYGGGFDWKPSERTDLYANAEHRFFGRSYSAGFTNRTRMTAFSLTGSRQLQTYPQQLPLPAGNTALILDAIFQARIPDPIERQQAVNKFIQQAGLPANLASPFTYYTNQIYVVEQIIGTFAIVGARNVLTFSASYYDSTPVTSSGASLPIAFTLANELKQTSLGISFNHKLTALDALTLTANRIVVFSNATNLSVNSTQYTFLPTISHNFTAKTSGSVGMRFVRFTSDVASNYTEVAALVGFLHTF